MIIDSVESGRLFSPLDGLPLAIAQAGTYLQFYEQEWKELIKSRDQADAPL